MYAVHCAMRLYWDGLSIEVVAQGLRDEIESLEIRKIAERNTLSPNGHNLTAGGDHGSMHLEEVRLRVIATKRRQGCTPRMRACADRQIGTKRSHQVCANQSAAHIGKPWTIARRIAFENSLSRIGVKRSPETCQKMSDAQIGKPKNLTKEQRAKISEGSKRSAFTPERVAQLALARANSYKTDRVAAGRKISASKMGHEVSQETRDKISAALRARKRPIPDL
jgi:hypothetical protein